MYLLWADRKRTRYVLTMAPVAALLTAFWTLPFLFGGAFMTDMTYERRPVGNAPNGQPDSYWQMLFPVRGVDRHPDLRAGHHRPGRLRDPRAAGGCLPRPGRRRVRRVGLHLAAEPPLERPPAAVHVPGPVPAGLHRRLRGGRAGRAPPPPRAARRRGPHAVRGAPLPVGPPGRRAGLVDRAVGHGIVRPRGRRAGVARSTGASTSSAGCPSPPSVSTTARPPTTGCSSGARSRASWTTGPAGTTPATRARPCTASSSRSWARCRSSARSGAAVGRCGSTRPATTCRATAPRWRSCCCRTSRTGASAPWRACTSRRPARRRTTSSPRPPARSRRPTRCAAWPTTTTTSTWPCATCRTSASATTWPSARRSWPRPTPTRISPRCARSGRGPSTRWRTATSSCR